MTFWPKKPCCVSASKACASNSSGCTSPAATLPGAVKPMQLTRKDGSEIGTLRGTPGAAAGAQHRGFARAHGGIELGNTILAKSPTRMVEATVVNAVVDWLGQRRTIRKMPGAAS